MGTREYTELQMKMTASNLATELVEKYRYPHILTYTEWEDLRVSIAKALATKLIIDHDLELHRSIHHLLSIWDQYGKSSGKDENGNLLLDHMNMQAGEQATQFLTRHGVGKDQGYCFAVNERGRAIMDDDSLDDC